MPTEFGEGPAWHPVWTSVKQSGGDRARGDRRLSGQWPDRPPVGRRAGSRGIAGGEQHSQLMRGQSPGGAIGDRGPPGEASLREPFVAEPESLAIIHEDLKRRGSAIAKDEDSTGKGIVLEGVLTEPSETIDAATEIDGLDSDEDLHLGSDLEHHRASQKLRDSAFRR